jgi:hypothetical protein
LIFIKLIFAWPIIISVALFRPIGRKHRRSVFSAVWKPEQPHMVLRWPKQAATPKEGMYHARKDIGDHQQRCDQRTTAGAGAGCERGQRRRSF